MSKHTDAAHEIMALVDEFPSEPFSYERKQVEAKLDTFLYIYTQTLDSELDDSFNLGFDEGSEQGHSEGYEEAMQEFEEEINDLKDRISDLEDELQDAQKRYEEGLADGIIISGN